MDAPSFPLLLPTSSLTSTYWNHHISHSMLKLLEKALIILSSLNTEKIEDGEEVAVEEVEDEQSKMEGMASIALLLDGSHTEVNILFSTNFCPWVIFISLIACPKNYNYYYGFQPFDASSLPHSPTLLHLLRRFAFMILLPHIQAILSKKY